MVWETEREPEQLTAIEDRMLKDPSSPRCHARLPMPNKLHRSWAAVVKVNPELRLLLLRARQHNAWLHQDLNPWLDSVATLLDLLRQTPPHELVNFGSAARTANRLNTKVAEALSRATTGFAIVAARDPRRTLLDEALVPFCHASTDEAEEEA